MAGSTATAIAGALALAASATFAAPNEEEIARLGGPELTPVGAERAGNAEGTIPGWTGGVTEPPPGWKPGMKRPDLFEFFDTITRAVRESAAKGLIRDTDPDKGVFLVIIILSSLVCMLPHMDLARAPGSAAYKDLSDPIQWKLFLADMLERIISSGDQ